MSMPAALDRYYTREEVLAFPDDGNRYELVQFRHELSVRLGVDPDRGRVAWTDTVALLRTAPERPPWREGEYFAARPVPAIGTDPYAFWRWEDDSLTLYRGGGWWATRWRVVLSRDSAHGWGYYATHDGGYGLYRVEGHRAACPSAGPGAT